MVDRGRTCSLIATLVLAVAWGCRIDFGIAQGSSDDTVIDDEPVNDGDIDDESVDDGIVLDLSAFRDFKIDRQHLASNGPDLTCVSELSYGSDDGDLFFVHISEVSGGSHYLRYREFEIDFDEPQCTTQSCVTEVTVVARTLSNAEVTQLRDLFRSIRVDSHRLGVPAARRWNRPAVRSTPGTAAPSRITKRPVASTSTTSSGSSRASEHCAVSSVGKAGKHKPRRQSGNAA